MPKAIYQATTYVAVTGSKERQRGADSLINQDGIVDEQNKKVNFNLHITGEDDPDCKFELSMLETGIHYLAGKKVDVRVISNITEVETMQVNFIKDGNQALGEGSIQPNDLLMAMQRGNQQSTEGLVYLAAYVKE